MVALTLNCSCSMIRISKTMSEIQHCVASVSPLNNTEERNEDLQESQEMVTATQAAPPETLPIVRPIANETAPDLVQNIKATYEIEPCIAPVSSLNSTEEQEELQESQAMVAKQEFLESQAMVTSMQAFRPQKLPIVRPIANETTPNSVQVVDVEESHQDVKSIIAKENAKMVSSPNAAKARGKRWKKHWVIQLIHLRGEMREEFSLPPKQGVALWRKVFERLCSVCPDFDKDAEACRKKWKAIYGDYKEDRILQAIAGNDRSNKCKWYDLVDKYYHDRGHVASCAPTSAHKNSNPRASEGCALASAHKNTNPRASEGSSAFSPLATETSEGTRQNSPPSKKMKSYVGDFHGHPQMRETKFITSEI